ncbi:MAG: DUF4393 domain-containing protein [Actinomycetota bacterium]|nr:DUF4393 domain-containing protein [Actinomycetota bacterium]
MVDERRALMAGDGADPPDLVDRAGRVLGRLYRGGWSVARRLPGGETAERIERAIVGEARERPGTPPERSWNAPTVEPPKPTGAREPLRAAMAELLERSVTDSRETARDHFFATVIRQLLPDEARIVSMLADGTVYPLVHLGVRTSFGGVHRLLLENASTVGRAAGVAQPGLVPLYVSRLLRFGLAEVGDDDPRLGAQYEALLGDDQVRAAVAKVNSRSGPRIVRLTLRISDIGRQFWVACDPSVRAIGPAKRL